MNICRGKASMYFSGFNKPLQRKEKGLSKYIRTLTSEAKRMEFNGKMVNH